LEKLPMLQEIDLMHSDDDTENEGESTANSNCNDKKNNPQSKVENCSDVRIISLSLNRKQVGLHRLNP
jgi:hypothetical protein